MSCCCVPLTVEGPVTISLDVSEATVGWNANEYIHVLTSEFPDYAGSYEASALFSEQVFHTNQTVMHDDFTVHAINYTEAPNQYGTTVTIGG